MRPLEHRTQHAARGLAALLLLAGAGLLVADEAQPKAPPELGDVAWERDFGRAEARAKASGKPLLVLFQEVPG